MIVFSIFLWILGPALSVFSAEVDFSPANVGLDCQVHAAPRCAGATKYKDFSVLFLRWSDAQCITRLQEVLSVPGAFSVLGDGADPKSKGFYTNPFFNAKDVRVTAQLVKDGCCYSALWAVGDMYTAVQSNKRDWITLAETVWFRMNEVFFQCLNLEKMALGQPFYSEGLDAIIPSLVQSLRAGGQKTTSVYAEILRKSLSYDGVRGERLTHEHVADFAFEGRRLWTVSRIADVVDCSDLTENVVRFFVPEVGLALEGVESSQ